MSKKGLIKSEWLYSPLFLFSFALIIRAIYLLTLSNDPWLFYPIVDEIAYHNTAVNIIETGKLNPPFFRPPFWPMIISLIYSITGPYFIVIRIFNILIGSLAVVSGFRLTNRLFSRKTALISSILFALTGLNVHINATGLDTSLFILVLLESIVFLVDFNEKKNFKYLIISALLVGIAILLRPMTLLTLAGITIFLFLGNRKNLYYSFIYVIIAFIPIMPFTILNYKHDVKTLLSTNGGINFYLGNNASADGFTPTHPELGPGWNQDDIERYAFDKSGHKMSSTEVSDWYYKQALRFYINHPFDGIVLLLKKTALTLGAGDISNNGDITWYLKYRLFLKLLYIIGFYILIPLGLCGIFLKWRNGNRYPLLLVTIFTLLLPSILFFTTARFRLPVLPLLIPFAVEAFLYLYSASNHPKSRFRYLLTFIILFIGGFFASYTLGPKPNHAYAEFLQGQLYLKADDDSKAISSFRKSLEINPHTPFANFYIGRIFFKEEMYDSTSAYMIREIGIRPRPRVYEYLAQSERKAGRHESSGDIWFEAHLKYPEKVSYISIAALEYNEAALRYSENGRWDKAILLFEKAHSIEPSNPYHRYGIACGKWVQGKKQEADNIIMEVATEYPDFTPAIQWLVDGWRPE